MNHVIAFDVSMGKSYFVLYNPLKKCEQEGEVMHSKSDFQVLQALIDDITDGYGVQPRIVFEATGAYSKPLERFMRDNDYDYCLLNPLEAKLQCDRLRIHKTDRSDAHQLAMTHFTNERLIKEDTDNRFHQLKQLSRYYNELDEELSVVRNRLHRALQEKFPEIEAMFTTKSHLFLNVIQLFPHPDLVLLHSKTIIKNCLLKHTKKRMSVKRAEEKATQLLEVAHNSYPAARSTDVICDQVHAYAVRFQELLSQKEACIQKMAQIAEPLEEFRILRSLPGVGEPSAVRLIAEIGDVRRFHTHKQLNAYCGIDIRRYQSGKFLAKDKINKRGNKHLRKLLYIIVLNMIKRQRSEANHIVDYYYKLKKQPKNKCHKVAVVACMNKLLKTIFYLVHQNEMYDYRLAPCIISPK